MIVFRKNNEIKINRNDALTIEQARKEFNLDKSWEAGYCKTYIDNYFDIINDKVIFWDLQKRADNNVLSLSPFNKVVNNQVINKSDKELVGQGIKTLAQIKAERTDYFSNYSMTVRQSAFPDYKLWNAALDIYDANEKGKIKQKCIDCRNEFYRIKALIDLALTVDELDKITWSLN